MYLILLYVVVFSLFIMHIPLLPLIGSSLETEKFILIKVSACVNVCDTKCDLIDISWFRYNNPLSSFITISIYINIINKYLWQDVVLPEAVRFWEQALMVRQTVGPIRLNRYVGVYSSQLYVDILNRNLWFILENATAPKYLWRMVTLIALIVAKVSQCVEKCKYPKSI